MLKVKGNMNNFGEIFATVKIDEYGFPLYEDKFIMLFGHRRMKNVKKEWCSLYAEH